MTRIASLAVLALAVGCGGGTSNTTDGGTTNNNTDAGGTTGSVQPTYSDISAKIFVPTCALTGCHGASSPQDGLVLTADKAYDMLVNQAVTDPNWNGTFTKRVIPGDKTHSALSACIEQRTGVSSVLYMPLGSKLPQDQVDAINTWITNGAPRN